MASLARRRSQNAPGPLYVDDTCIDCDTCRWMAPTVFHEVDGMSAVHRQPAAPGEQDEALQALLSCPTASIGYEGPVDWKAVQETFPLPITPDTSHCGYHAKSSFGAASYLIQSPTGNVLVDSPRFAGPLVSRLEALGGLDWLVLTHRDDVADHARFQEHFGCRRVIHEHDASALPEAEVVVRGEEPVEVLPGLTAIPVPGHTRGHMVFHWTGGEEPVLFTGDHLAWSAARGRLTAFRGACWYDWDTQIRSMRRLRDVPFAWVLPGHGRRIHLEPAEMRQSLDACIAWMETA